jgi:hypothetical protein
MIVIPTPCFAAQFLRLGQIDFGEVDGRDTKLEPRRIHRIAVFTLA